MMGHITQKLPAIFFAATSIYKERSEVGDHFSLPLSYPHPPTFLTQSLAFRTTGRSRCWGGFAQVPHSNRKNEEERTPTLNNQLIGDVVTLVVTLKKKPL